MIIHAVGGESASIFIGNLSWNVNEDALKGFFEENEINPVSVRVITNAEGRSKGYGYYQSFVIFALMKSMYECNSLAFQYTCTSAIQLFATIILLPVSGAIAER